MSKEIDAGELVAHDSSELCTKLEFPEDVVSVVMGDVVKLMKEYTEANVKIDPTDIFKMTELIKSDDDEIRRAMSFIMGMQAASSRLRKVAREGYNIIM